MTRVIKHPRKPRFEVLFGGVAGTVSWLGPHVCRDGAGNRLGV